jgi:hypothetical protein
MEFSLVVVVIVVVVAAAAAAAAVTVTVVSLAYTLNFILYSDIYVSRRGHRNCQSTVQ